jgi:signal transduction histidine kinase
VGFGAHDWLLQNWRIDIESVYLLPMGVVALFVMFLTTLARRYLQALTASEKASALLEVRLSDRERELRESYSKLHEIEQSQMLSQERQRLMREMHDGLGSALMSSLVAVERGQMQPGEIAQVLRECVDDLKLTIDSLEPVDDDLLVVLATLRYRLEPRLDAAGIKLSWEVQPVPTLSWLNPNSALQILRMLQEILANILKHARARCIRVVTQQQGDKIMIIVADDGAGFDVAARSTGRGLNNLRRRAADIDGSVDIESHSGGTSVTISLPIERAL